MAEVSPTESYSAGEAVCLTVFTHAHSLYFMDKARRLHFLTVSALCLTLAACSGSKGAPESGTAIAPTPDMVHSQPKGLNLGNPTTPDKKVAIQKDADDMHPNPAPSVEVADLVANEKPDVEARLSNLEAQLAALRADYDQIVPTFKTLSLNTDRLVTLLDELEGKQVAGVKPAAGPALSAEAMAGSAAVKKVRIGEHNNRTRIVLDVDVLTPYSFDVDNVEGVVMVSLPDAQWKAGAMQEALRSPYIQSWSMQAMPNGGSALVLQTRKPVKISAHSALPGDGTTSPRIYFDLSAS